jgi:hypothetical protein
MASTVEMPHALIANRMARILPRAEPGATRIPGEKRRPHQDARRETLNHR